MTTEPRLTTFLYCSSIEIDDGGVLNIGGVGDAAVICDPSKPVDLMFFIGIENIPDHQPLRGCITRSDGSPAQGFTIMVPELAGPAISRRGFRWFTVILDDPRPGEIQVHLGTDSVRLGSLNMTLMQAAPEAADESDIDALLAGLSL